MAYNKIRGHFIINNSIQLILFLLIFILIITIFLIYKLVNKSEKKNNMTISIVSVAFLIPFANLILYLSSQTGYIDAKFSIAALLIGFCSLVILIPTLFLLFLLIPKREFEYKNIVLLTIFLTEIIGWFFIFVSGFLQDAITLLQLEEYRPSINYIKNYKKEHGVYPTSLKKGLNHSKSHPYYVYKIFNNGNDFKIMVSRFEYIIDYNYCSSKKLDGCDENSKNSKYKYYKFGEWIKEVNLED